MSETLGSRDDRALWETRYLERCGDQPGSPSSWVLERCLSLPATTVYLDIAGGSGRHAAPLAAQGRTVVVLDFIERAIRAAVERHASIRGVVADVTALPLCAESVDAVVVVNFLERSAFHAFARLLRPSGTLVYETFTREHLDVVARGLASGPRNPEFLLEPDELPRLVSPLSVLEHEEGLVIDDAGERHVARVRAIKRS